MKKLLLTFILNYTWLVSRHIVICSYADQLQTQCGQNAYSYCPSHDQCPASKRICDSGYVEVQGRCYFFSKDFKSYNDAKLECKKRGGTLAVLDTQNKVFVIMAKAEELGSVSGAAYWIGLNDLKTEGRFEWVTGKPLSYSSWCKGEPAEDTENQDCVDLTLRGDYCWNDWECSDELSYICEKPA